MDGAAACVRCRRSEDEHQLGDQADEIQVRIWKALGFPCPEFTDTPAQAFAGQQAATSRWARRPPARPAAGSVLAPAASAPPDIARHGAAAARAALAARQNTREGT
jgi:hypothetical protein